MSEDLQIAVGLAAPHSTPVPFIRKPVPQEVADYLAARSGIGWRQLQSEVAEAFGLRMAPNTLLKFRGRRSSP